MCAMQSGHLLPIQRIILNVGAIITPTESGHTAQMISKYRPKAPIIAVTSNDHVLEDLH